MVDVEQQSIGSVENDKALILQALDYFMQCKDDLPPAIHDIACEHGSVVSNKEVDDLTHFINTFEGDEFSFVGDDLNVVLAGLRILQRKETAKVRQIDLLCERLNLDKSL